MYGSSDTKQAAQEAASILCDPRVVQYYDPDKLAGKALAASLGSDDSEIAWDIYLFYGKNSEWLSDPPSPVSWMHQLSGRSWIDQDRLRCGQALLVALYNGMESLMAGSL